MTDTSNLDRIDALVARLERLGINLTDAVTPLAYAQPGNVAPGELIESAWGNAVVAHLGVNYGGMSLGSTPMVGGTPILAQTPPPQPFDTWMMVWVNGHAGSDGGAMDGVNLTVRTNLGAFYRTPEGVGGPANRFGNTSAMVQYLVPANGDAGFHVEINWVLNAGGTTFVAGDHTWNQYRYYP